ncbi:IPT/TIG domain-containing protein [Microbacterium esteraromaticum]|uniref:phage tail tube protein n=1 Tax=Microbacterium esteraromaticum TaxID=57043 RepID=UPI002368732B|nr:IPT/TIG domain-containing protein [Microbacterium esteraromaticum]WDH80202.1 IPT/TIG domain-containing protein [Microbacterium esteraromaticum]
MSNRVPLPAGTVLGKSYEYGLDVNLGTYANPDWQSVRRMSAWQPSYPGTTTDVSTYDDLGSANEDVTGRSFAASLTVQGNRALSTGLYLPELEAMVAAAKGKGEGAVLDVRWYHKPELGTPNPDDAGRSYVTVEITRSNTDNTGIEVKSITLTGKGEFEQIPNPFQGWGATAPTIQGITPSGAISGEMVTINGAGFLDASSVTFDAIEAGDFQVINGATIVALLPTDTAGEVPVVVSTPGGVSAAYTYTRGA